MAAARRDAGLAPPVLEEIGTRFPVTLRLERIGRLLQLVGRGLVREVGTSPQDPKRRYFLSS